MLVGIKGHHAVGSGGLGAFRDFSDDGSGLTHVDAPDGAVTGHGSKIARDDGKDFGVAGEFGNASEACGGKGVDERGLRDGA